MIRPETEVQMQQVLKLLIEGEANLSIGKKLGMKERTVKSYCTRLFRQHNITSGLKRVQLARKFARPQLQKTTFPLKHKYRLIIHLIQQGFKNKDIAKVLFTTQHVIKNYTRDIYNITGMSNRIELLQWALEKDIDSAEPMLLPSPRRKKSKQ